jgi:hypothetical protein
VEKMSEIENEYYKTLEKRESVGNLGNFILFIGLGILIATSVIFCGTVSDEKQITIIFNEETQEYNSFVILFMVGNLITMIGIILSLFSLEKNENKRYEKYKKEKELNKFIEVNKEEIKKRLK